MIHYEPDTNDPVPYPTTWPGDRVNWYGSRASLIDKTTTIKFPPLPGIKFREYDPALVNDPSGVGVASDADLSVTGAESAGVVLYFRCGRERYTHLSTDPGGAQTQSYVLHYELRFTSSDPDSGIFWIAPTLFGGELEADATVTTAFGPQAVIMNSGTWTSITETGLPNSWPTAYEEFDLALFLFSINPDFTTGPAPGDVYVSKIEMRNCWLETFGEGEGPGPGAATPGLRLDQRDDGAGVRGHARQNVSDGHGQITSQQESLRVHGSNTYV